jgi:FlaA1/EpsC-like NDP-sugar epimerase
MVAYGPAAREMVTGQRVLVTGAGGSIGSELVRQLQKLNPAMLYLLDHDESSMHAVQLELYGDGQLDHERTILADIRDRRRLTDLFCEVRPDLIFHAAAHKHVTILERYPSEAVRTNVLGTDNVVRAAQACGAERLVFVSTDKAANPSSVLGVTKRLGELLTHQGATEQLKTASVRFGNVLGSRGSFLHTLKHQIEEGMPVTVTHPEAERFFMSIPEAAALVIEAAVAASNGETYVLDMGAPVRIVDLVIRFAEVNGVRKPQVTFTGLSRGEKLSEELVDVNEVALPTRHARITQVPVTDDRFGTLTELNQLYAVALAGDEAAVRDALWNSVRQPSAAPWSLERLAL